MPLHRYGHLWLTQVVQNCIHPSLEHFWGQCIRNFPGQLQSSVLPHPHSKDFFFFLASSLKLPSFSSNLLLMLMLLLILVKSLFLSALQISLIYWQACFKVSLEPACSSPEWTSTLSAFCHRTDVPAFWFFMPFLWICSNRLMSLFCWGPQR